jgi:polyketide synthase 7
MLSVGLPAARLEARLAAGDGAISLAAENGAESAILSGDADALARLRDELLAEGVNRAKLVPVDYASHSPAVDAIRDRLLADLAPLAPVAPAIPMMSTVTGDWVRDRELDAEYWFSNLRRTVRFADGVRALTEARHAAFVEVSAHPVLGLSIQETLDELSVPAVVTGTLRRDEGGLDRFTASLAALHVRGVSPDWRRVFPDARVVDVPTYPFQRQRYWLDERARAGAANPGTARAEAASAGAASDAEFWDEVERADADALAGRLRLGPEEIKPLLPALANWRRERTADAVVDSWRYQVQWQPVLGLEPRPVLRGTWLLAAASGSGRAGRVEQALKAHGADVTVIDTAIDVEQIESARLDFGDPATSDAATVAGVLIVAERLPGAPDDDVEREDGVPAPVWSTVTAFQRVRRAGITAPVWVLTQDAVAVTGRERVDPGSAALIGLGTVLSLDHPADWGGLVDLPADAESGDRELARLCAVLAGHEHEDQVAVRRNGVFGRRLVRAPRVATPASVTPASLTPAPATPLADGWRSRGTVLVTGGTGGVGAHVARWLATAGAGHLLLAGRRGAEAPGARELAAELAAYGVGVTVEACDVADEDAVRTLLDSIPGDRPLTAVIHAAGTLPDELPLTETTRARFAEATRAKVAGAANLDRVLGDRPLDAFVLFASGAAVWGTAGKPGYATANAYLDGLARDRRARGLAGTAVAWGSWGGGGMVDELTGERLRRLGLAEMEPRLAVRALSQALTADEPHLVVADLDWPRFAPVYALARPRPLLRALPDAVRVLAADGAASPADASGPATDASGASGASGGRPALVDRLAALAPADRARTLLTAVREQAAAVLGHPGPADVDPHRAFKELGFDSVTAVDLRNRLGAATGLRLPATVVFDYANAKALADHLGSRLGGAPDATTVLGDLDRLAEKTAALAPEEAAAAGLAARLRDLASRLDAGPAGAVAAPGVRDAAAVGGVAGAAGAAGGGEAIESLLADAAAEDVFDLLDRQLGSDAMRGL